MHNGGLRRTIELSTDKKKTNTNRVRHRQTDTHTHRQIHIHLYRLYSQRGSVRETNADHSRTGFVFYRPIIFDQKMLTEQPFYSIQTSINMNVFPQYFTLKPSL